MRAAGAFLLAACGAIAAHGAEGDGPGLSLSGFGTLGAVTTDLHDADFVTSHTQPHGAGATQRVAFGPDSKVGLQLDGSAGPVSAVLQVVSQLQPTGNYAPRVEWANVKYQISPDWSVRAGRVALPVLMDSDYRLIGFANTAIRPPIEAYSIIPDTSINGVDTSWRRQIGTATNSVQALYGAFLQDFPQGGSIRVPHSWGLSDWLDLGPVMVHGAFASASLVWHDPLTDGLVSGLDQYGGLLSSIPGLGLQGMQAFDLVRNYNVYGQSTHLVSLGATYDRAAWYAAAEWVSMTRAGFIPANRAGYFTVGYRIDRIMPYATVAALKSTRVSPTLISTAGLPPVLAQPADRLNADISGLLSAQYDSQNTRSLGVRVDLRSNLDLKFQADKTDLDAGSPGLLTAYGPAFRTGSSFYAYSLALDFVF